MNATFKNFLVKGQRPDFSRFGASDIKTAGEIFTNSEAYKNFVANGKSESDNVTIPSFTKATLTSTGAGGRLLGETQYLQTINGPAEQQMTLRDLLAVQPTRNNAVEYLRETGYTNASAGVPETNLAPESTITFEEVTALVKTIMHFIPVTRQIVADVPSMQAYIDQRLIYGLRVTEENQILNGTGTGENLQGILTTTGVQNAGGIVTGDTRIDHLRKALTRVYISGYPPTGIVLHPNDFEDIELLKDTAGNYIVSTVNNGAEMKIFRTPVVLTTAIAEGTFLAGAFGIGAQLFDREEAHVRVSEHHSDFFIRKQLAVLAEERVALTIYRPEAFVKGSFAPAV